MNEQEVFDRVTKHLLTQLKRSLEANVCRYRQFNDEGDVVGKCAVGCLIDDAHYSNELEDINVYEPEVYEKVSASLGIETLSELEINFLSKLQRIHDSYEPVTWESQLKEFALNHGLTFNPPTEKGAE